MRNEGLKYLLDIISGNSDITDELINENESSPDVQMLLTTLKAVQDLIIRKDQKILQLEEDNKALLAELYDRVNNNMQIISSLLSLQSDYVENEETKSLIRYCQYRLKSMSLVHEVLYKSKDLAKIEYGKYIEMLANHLAITMKGHDNKVHFHFDISPILLNIETAIPLGLLLNEILTNSLKYGIKDQNKGNIYIKLQESKYPNYVLHIKDDGEGFDNDKDFRSSESLGLLLIHKLTLQLKGNIEKVNQEKGTYYIISFRRIG
ncbi:hypothetical protein K6119_16385 [Paracrocinitomix mangrovi]|uniref:sensor histidine kinase n=1 Tax=Paracrocinitomix mangrovi TaxID=2862509 RepID=UPI001C8E220C|nr:histidine kinase dimerization/phosphoacceptor domain -containing protein [Paracrocinitomix mangrovi]UKN01307.1 hypothetical protein K6119_16385 [Paracrocinitomix mangrovi]